jgi:hypothetical protein
VVAWAKEEKKKVVRVDARKELIHLERDGFGGLDVVTRDHADTHASRMRRD